MQEVNGEIRRNPDIIALLVLWIFLGAGFRVDKPLVWIDPPQSQGQYRIWTEPVESTLDAIADSIDIGLNRYLDF